MNRDMGAPVMDARESRRMQTLLRDSAQLSTLPEWCRKEMESAADMIAHLTARAEAAEAKLVAWDEMVTMAHANRDGLWPNNWPRNVAWIAQCLHSGSLPPTMTDDTAIDQAMADKGGK